MAEDTIVFRVGEEPLTVGVHQTTLITEDGSYPVTLTVHEDGSVTVRSDPHLGSDAE